MYGKGLDRQSTKNETKLKIAIQSDIETIDEDESEKIVLMPSPADPTEGLLLS